MCLSPSEASRLLEDAPEQIKPTPQPHHDPVQDNCAIRAVKAWYFTFFAAQITQLFLPLILATDLHLPDHWIGLLMGMRRLIVTLGSPLFTVLCDRTLCHRQLLSVALSGYFICSGTLPLLSTLPFITFLMLVRELLVAGCEPAINSAALEKIETSQTLELNANFRVDFGQVRSWGSIGWGFAGLVVPVLSATIAHGTYLPVLYVHCLLGIPTVLLIAIGHVDVSPKLFCKHQRKMDQTTSDPMASSSLSIEVTEIAERTTRSTLTTSNITRKCLGNVGRLIPMGMGLLLQGIDIGAMQCTQMLYLSRCGVPTAVLGLSMTVGSLSEAWVFSLHGRIRKRISNERGMQMGVLGSVSVLVMYACVSEIRTGGMVARVFMALAAACLNGGFHALFVCSVVSATQEETSPQLRTSAQGMMQAVLYGFGPACGAAGAGVGMQVFGAPIVYFALAVANLILVLVMQMSIF